MSIVEMGVGEIQVVTCPNCGSVKIAGCEGGSNMEPVEGIHLICTECCYEW